MTVGKLVLRKAQNLKEGDKVYCKLNKTTLVVWKLIDDGVIFYTLEFEQHHRAAPISELEQFHIEYQEHFRIIKDPNTGIPTGSETVTKSLPLSFDDYSEAIKLLENSQVEFEIEEKNIKGIKPNGFKGEDYWLKTDIARLVVKEEKRTKAEIRKERDEAVRFCVEAENEASKDRLDWELNKFAHHCLTNRIKFNDSNQIAQIIIDYLK